MTHLDGLDVEVFRRKSPTSTGTSGEDGHCQSFVDHFPRIQTSHNTKQVDVSREIEKREEVRQPLRVDCDGVLLLVAALQMPPEAAEGQLGPSEV